LWDTARTAEYLGVPPATLDQWAYRGIGPAFSKVGRHRRYRHADVTAWLDTNRRCGVGT
jgi:excisionase family DNA binding protein